MNDEAAAPQPAVQQALDALRGSGADRLDPVRWRHLEALARRAQGHHGAVRQVLEERLQALVQAYADRPATAEADPAEPAPQPSPLSTLLAQLGTAAPGTAQRSTTGINTTAAPPRTELKAVRDYRHTWTQLRASQRLQQALATVPGKAGPLNTQRLLHQALTAMHAASPAYLQAFMTQVETLLWLEQLGRGSTVPSRDNGKPGPRRTGSA